MYAIVLVMQISDRRKLTCRGFLGNPDKSCVDEVMDWSSPR